MKKCITYKNVMDKLANCIKNKSIYNTYVETETKMNFDFDQIANPFCTK